MGRLLHQCSATAIAAMIRDGVVSSVEATQYFLERIERLNGRNSAFLKVTPERALAQAKKADQALRRGHSLGPFQGVPYAAKDLFDVAGLSTTAGCDLLDGAPKAMSAAVIETLDRSGMVFLGKTSLVQFAHGSIGMNLNQGTPHNPWSGPARAPGGSSSGSAVAVAAGMTPLALGSDTAGSVRGPAALCGVLGLLPTQDEISRKGVYPLSTTLDAVGLLTTTPQDAWTLLQLASGRYCGEDQLAPSPDHLPRLAYAESLFAGADPEVVAAVRKAGRALAQRGAELATIPFHEADEAKAINPNGLISVVEGYHQNAALLATGSPWLDAMVSQSFAAGPTSLANDYYGALQAMAPLRARTLATLEPFDVLLAPTTPIVAALLEQASASSQAYSKMNSAYGSLTRSINVLGLCAVSVPCGLSADGLPIGLQIIGKPRQERLVLEVASAVVEACWDGTIPSPPEPCERP